jgi:hypothetical protein
MLSLSVSNRACFSILQEDNRESQIRQGNLIPLNVRQAKGGRRRSALILAADRLENPISEVASGLIYRWKVVK